jgi:hypothetical protein
MLNPSICYWTLVDILDRSIRDPEVQNAKTAIAQQPLVKRLFAKYAISVRYAYTVESGALNSFS